MVFVAVLCFLMFHHRLRKRSFESLCVSTADAIRAIIMPNSPLNEVETLVDTECSLHPKQTSTPFDIPKSRLNLWVIHSNPDCFFLFSGINQTSQAHLLKISNSSNIYPCCLCGIVTWSYWQVNPIPTQSTLQFFSEHQRLFLVF